MNGDYIVDVWHAAITQLQGISVKYFVPRMVGREAIINILEELATDIVKYKHATELSKYIWHLRELNIEYSLTWKIIQQCKFCKSYSN